MYQVVDWERDVAGKFRYRVLINGNSVMLKFHNFPTDEDVQAEAVRYDQMMQEQENAIADQSAATDA